MEYFGNKTEVDDNPAWTPPAESTAAQTPPEQLVTGEITTITAAPQPEEEITESGKYAVSIPAAALLNTSSLSAYAAKASSEGYTAALVWLKDNAGNIRYNLEITDGEQVVGALTATEISVVLSQNDLIPIAVVSVLKDNAGCIDNPDMSYKIYNEENVSWLDYKSGTPVRWANPESTATSEYNKAVVGELFAAGFKRVILSDIVFPNFQDYDREFIAAKYFSSDRYKYLTSIIFDGTDVMADAEDIILNSFTGTAEFLRSRAELTDKTLFVRIKRDAFSAENGYPAAAPALFEDVMSQVSLMSPTKNVVPVIEGVGFTPTEIAAMKETAEKMGYSEFYVW